MVLLAGHIFTADARTLIYESGDNVETIAYIVKGTVTVEKDFSTRTINAGDFVAYEDMYNGFYSATYTAEAGTQLLPIIADSPSSLVQFLNSNQGTHDKLAMPMCKFIVNIQKLYQDLFNDTVELYSAIDSAHSRYRQCCFDISVKPEEFIMPHDSSHYSFDSQDFSKNYNIMASLAASPAKADSVYKANGVKFLMIQTNLIKNIFTVYEDLTFYMRSMLSLFVGKSDNCLFALVARLCQKTGNSNSVMFLLEDMKATVKNLDVTIQALLLTSTTTESIYSSLWLLLTAKTMSMQNPLMMILTLTLIILHMMMTILRSMKKAITMNTKNILMICLISQIH